MKMKLFLIVLILSFIFGCKEKQEIEIIPSNDVYFPINEVDQIAKLLEEPMTIKLHLELYDSVKILYELMEEKERENFTVDYRLLINETGRVDKIQIIKSKYPGIDKMVATIVKDFKFTGAIKDGKPVKSIFPYMFPKAIFTSNVQNREGPDNDVYFVKVDEMPMPIGGMQSIQEKILYPELAKRAGIEGRVFIQAFIDENGNVADAKVIKGVGHGLDEAALEAVKKTKFAPGKQKGKPVKVQVSIPIVFKLDSQNTIYKILSYLNWGASPSHIKNILTREFPFNSYEELIQVNESKNKSKIYEYSGGSLYGVPTSNWAFVFYDERLDFIAVRIKTNSPANKSGTFTILKNEIEKLAREKNSDRLNEWVLSDAKRTIVRLQILPKDNPYDILMILSSGKLIDKNMFN